MLPETKFYQPEKEISWLVRHYEFIRYRGEKVLTDKFVPREDVSIVFHFLDRPRLVSPVDLLLPQIFIAPLVPTANLIRIQGHLDSFIVTCRPSVLSRILGISISSGNHICVSLPDEIFVPLWEKLKGEQAESGRIKIFTEFFMTIHPSRYIPDETDQVYEAIVQKGINTSLQDIINGFSCSERTLQRRFRIRLGTTPKMLVRILRINYIWDSINSGRKIDYHDLVFLGKYFDQTHLIKDFKSITGETPDVFFRRNLGMARIFSGK